MLWSIIFSLILGGIAGWLAGIIRRGEGYGFLGNIIIGLVGGLVGSLILGWLGIEGVGIISQVVIATFGAILLLWLLNLFSRTNQV